MQIEYLRLDELIPYENNPRDNDGAVDAVANSIREFGFKVPIIIDKSNVIVAGHTRLKAAYKLGMTEVPVVRADDLTEEQVKAFRLADNKTGELADWIYFQLEEELKDIKNIEMLQFGFDEVLEAIEEQDKAGKAQEEQRKIPESHIYIYMFPFWKSVGKTVRV